MRFRLKMEKKGVTHVRLAVADDELAGHRETAEEGLALDPRDDTPVPGLALENRGVRGGHRKGQSNLLAGRRLGLHSHPHLLMMILLPMLLLLLDLGEEAGMLRRRRKKATGDGGGRGDSVFGMLGSLDNADVVPRHETGVAIGVATAPPVWVVRGFLQDLEDLVGAE